MEYKKELISWSNTFSCGIKLIDDQHKELVVLVNDLFSHSSGDENEEHEYFNSVIEKAKNYIKIHFATEEKIMRTVKYSGFAEHKKAHDHFVHTVTLNILRYKSDKHYSLYSFTKYLKEWILSHIAVMDKEYFIYFKQIATRKADNKLSITSADIK